MYILYQDDAVLDAYLALKAEEKEYIAAGTYTEGGPGGSGHPVRQADGVQRRTHCREHRRVDAFSTVPAECHTCGLRSVFLTRVSPEKQMGSDSVTCGRRNSASSYIKSRAYIAF